MKNGLVFSPLPLLALILSLAPTSFASTTLYVNGVSGSDSNHCLSAQVACKTIGHAISLASSGDSVRVASATYRENLLIRFSLNVIGSGARTTIIDGGGINCPAKLSVVGCTVITIFPATTATVVLSGLTIRNGSPQYSTMGGSDGDGGGIYNLNGTLTINNSTVSGNVANGGECSFFPPRNCYGGRGGGIYNLNGTLTINNSTVSGNAVAPPICGKYVRCFPPEGGGIASSGTLTINNSTVSGNSAEQGGGIASSGTLSINNGTISGNSAGQQGGGIYGGTAILENSIVADNGGGNCFSSMVSKGYNLSSDGTCNFNKPGDLNNHNPLLGPLQNNGGPTQTMALLPGSPAIDGGNPSGCTDGQGHLLKTDQRGMPRPDPEDRGGCDMGAYERQGD